MPTRSPTPSLTLSPASTTSDNENHRPFSYGLLSAAEAKASKQQAITSGLARPRGLGDRQSSAPTRLAGATHQARRSLAQTAPLIYESSTSVLFKSARSLRAVDTAF